MKKDKQLGIRWQEPAKELWDDLAQNYFRREPTALARAVLEEFMACFVNDAQLRAAGLPALAARRPAMLLTMAIKAVAESVHARKGRISEETEELVVAGLRVILDRAPATVVEDLTDRVTRLAGKYGRE